tara:strand:- start:242 stop:454 length:213 start_codon:yes stop_codon:yes gene_type:complete
MPKKPKKSPEPVPTQDQSQFKASMVVDSKPKIKKVDIFEDMTESQKKRAKHREVLKNKMKESKAKKKKSN